MFCRFLYSNKLLSISAIFVTPVLELPFLTAFNTIQYVFVAIQHFYLSRASVVSPVRIEYFIEVLNEPCSHLVNMHELGYYLAHLLNIIYLRRKS